MTNVLTWATAMEVPRVHYAALGPWLFVVTPYTSNRFGAYSQRIGWERSDVRIFRTVETAKAALDAEAKLIQLGKRQ